MSTSILDYLDACLDSNKTDYFLGDMDHVLSRQESKDLVYKYANCISDYENQNKQLCIAILLPRNVDYLACIFATWLSGHFYIPLNLEWPKEHIEKILSMAQPDLLITNESTSNSTFTTVNVEEWSKASQPPEHMILEWLNRRSQDGLAYVIYTSGSTGEQKGVMISKDALASYVDWTSRYFASYKSNRALLQNGELNFDISLADISTVLALDLELHISPSTQNLITHALLLKKRNIDTFYGVPSTISRLFSWIETRPDIDIGQLALVLSGGDIVTFDMIKLVARVAPQAHFFNMYGPTETTMNCLSNRIDQWLPQSPSDTVPTGYPLDHLQCHLINDKREICSELEAEGELVVGGKQCMEGYLGDGAKTKQAFIEIAGTQFYRTGDLFRRDNNGLHFFIGRSDSLVKIKGYRINTVSITNVISESDQIAEACTIVATGILDQEKAIVSYVTLKDDSSISQDEILGLCKKKLPSYMIPSRIYILERFPLGRTGKFDLNALKEQTILGQYG